MRPVSIRSVATNVRPPLAWALASVLLVTGCGGIDYHIKISGLRDPQASAKTKYVLRPTAKVNPSDLQFREFSTYTNRALALHGFTLVDDENDAELAIFLDYGIGERPTTYTVTPGFGGPDVEANESFFRWARLEAVDGPEFFKSQKVVELWRTTMASSGANANLRVVFPILLAAGQPYFGKDTPQDVFRVLDDGSPEVIAIRAK